MRGEPRTILYIFVFKTEFGKVFVNVDNGIGVSCSFRGKADEMICGGNGNIRNGAAVVCSAEVVVKVGNDALIAAAVTAENTFLRFLYGYG